MAGRRIRVNLPISVLKDKLRGDGYIEDYAEEILRDIECDIEEAIENERSSVITEVDTIFNVPNMSNSAAQRDIYYLVCVALIKAGYSPKLLCQGVKSETQRVFIMTKWKDLINLEQDKYKDEFLSKITISVRAPRKKIQKQRPK